MEFVPAPATILAPVGTVQLYVATPAPAVTEYTTPDVPGHTRVGNPGVKMGTLTTFWMENVLTTLVPQAL